ncbi:hypothetical protein P4C99_18830 [Pontiellaceae bacterium B1224]|nr:hypothetical protein [Pontiellaceae bacterium B1224]
MMRKPIIVLTLAVLLLVQFSCSNIGSDHVDPRLQENIYNSSRWVLLEFFRISDGGSRLYYFENKDGVDFCIWEDNGLQKADDSKQCYYIVLYQGEETKFDIPAGSEVERRIVKLIQDCECSGATRGYDCERLKKSLVTGLKDRKRRQRVMLLLRESPKVKMTEKEKEELAREIYWYD